MFQAYELVLQLLYRVIFHISRPRGQRWQASVLWVAYTRISESYSGDVVQLMLKIVKRLILNIWRAWWQGWTTWSCSFWRSINFFFLCPVRMQQFPKGAVCSLYSRKS